MHVHSSCCVGLKILMVRIAFLNVDGMTYPSNLIYLSLFSVPLKLAPFCSIWVHFRLKMVKTNPGSFGEQLVTNWMEMGLYVLKMLDRLNEHLRKDGRPEVGHRVVYGCWLRLRTTQTVIKSRQQTGGTKWSHTGHC